jgi:hypothetical protein
MTGDDRHDLLDPPEWEKRERERFYTRGAIGNRIPERPAPNVIRAARREPGGFYEGYIVMVIAAAMLAIALYAAHTIADRKCSAIGLRPYSSWVLVFEGLCVRPDGALVAPGAVGGE